MLRFLSEISSDRIAYKLASCYMKTHCYDIAKDILDDLVEQSPHNILFQIKYRKCINSILKTLSINIEEIENTIYQLELLYAAQENEKIISLVDEYSEKTQDFKLLGKFSFYKAKALMRCNKTKDAFACFNDAYKYAKKRAENTYEEALEVLALSIHYSDLDCELIADPEALLLEALEAFPERDNILYLLGELYRKDKNDPAQAVFFYNKAIEKNPENFSAYESRANAYFTLKENEKCINDCNKVTKQFYQRKTMLSLKSHAYYNLALFEKAKNGFEWLFKYHIFEKTNYNDLKFYLYSCKNLITNNYPKSPYDNDINHFLKTEFTDEHLEIFKQALPYNRLYLEKLNDRKDIDLDEIFITFLYIIKSKFKLDDYEGSISTAREGLEYLDKTGSDYRYYWFYIAHYWYVIGECYYNLNDMACAVNAFAETVNIYGASIDITIAATREKLGDIILYREYEYNVNGIHHHYNYCIDTYKKLSEKLEDKSLKPHNEIIAQLYARMANHPLHDMTDKDIADYRRNALAYAEETDGRYDFHRALIHHYIDFRNFDTALQELDSFYQIANSNNNISEVFTFHKIKVCYLIAMEKFDDAYNEHEACLEISANLPEGIYSRFNTLIDQADILYHYRDSITKTYNEALEITEKFYNEISSTDKEGHTYQILTIFVQQLLINVLPHKAIKLIEQHAGNDNEFMPDLLKEAQQLNKIKERK